MIEEIQRISITKSRVLYNYNALAEKFPMSRKDKEKLVELLEEFHPLEKKISQKLMQTKKKKGNQLRGSFSHSHTQKILPQISLPRKQTLGMGKIEEGVHLSSHDKTRELMIARIPGLSAIKTKASKLSNEFVRTKKKLISNLELDLEDIDSPAEFIATFPELDRVIKLSDELPLSAIDFMRIKIGDGEFELSNGTPSQSLLFHLIADSDQYLTLKKLTLYFSTISLELMIYLLEQIISLALEIVTIDFEGLNLSNIPETLLERLAKVDTLKQIRMVNCKLNSKQFGSLCLGIVATRNIRRLDFRNNEIDSYGGNFLINLIKYYLPLEDVDLRGNSIDSEGISQIKKAVKHSKRITPDNIRI